MGMFDYIEAPDRRPFIKHKSLFLAGGITGCSDWQSIVAGQLKDLEIAVLNPRRNDWPASTDDREIKRQILWEHDMMRAVDGVLFWFPPETLCPITLYELGAMSERGGKIFIGCDLNYKRRLDVEVQTRISQAAATVHGGLGTLVAEVRDWVDEVPY